MVMTMTKIKVPTMMTTGTLSNLSPLDTTVIGQLLQKGIHQVAAETQEAIQASLDYHSVVVLAAVVDHQEEVVLEVAVEDIRVAVAIVEEVAGVEIVAAAVTKAVATGIVTVIK